jgi:ribonuclease T2
MRWIGILLLMAGLAQAEGERAGDFDYYVLSLSWSPTWCSLEGDARSSPQCEESQQFSWVLHGLWPQYDMGYPTYCRTSSRDPSRSETAAMQDIMGTSGAAWYQWKKHGRCAGLGATDFLETSRRAYEAISLPQVFARLTKDVQLPALVVEEAFLQSNPSMSPNMITVTCEQGMIEEVRICLTKDLELRHCGADVARDCRMSNALMQGVR